MERSRKSPRSSRSCKTSGDPDSTRLCLPIPARGFAWEENRMEVSNDTDQDTKYKVSGGGVPIPKGTSKWDTSKWPVLAKRTGIQHSPTLPGPWWIAFAVNGKQLVGEANSAADHVTLKKIGRTYQVEVCKLFR